MEDDEKQQPTQQPEAAAQPTDSAGKPEEKLFTQDQVNELIRERLRRDRQKAQQKKEEPPKETPQAFDQEGIRKLVAETVAATLQGHTAEQAKAQLFDKTTEGLKLSSFQRDSLLREFDPQNPKATIEMAKREFGKSVEPETASGGAPPNGNAPPYVSPGAPGGATPLEHKTNPIEWSRQDVDQLIATGQFKSAIERWRKGLSGGGNPFSRRIPGEKNG